MYILTSLVLVALSFFAEDASGTELSIPLSKRSTLRRTDGGIDITKVHASRHHTIAKIKRGFQRHEKNTGKPHPLVSKPKHPNSMHQRKFVHSHRGPIASGETVYNQPGDWFGPITVGTPEQIFTVQFDTGSSDLFIPDISCGAACNGHTLYDPSQSSTTQHIDGPVNIGYGGNTGNSSVTVQLYTDTVTLAGYMATNQTFGSATNMTGFDISYFTADGIMGLGFRPLSAYNASPVFQSLVAQGQLPKSVFGLYMTQANDSELYLGGVNKKHYSGSITYVTVEDPAYWKTSFDNVIVNGKSVLGKTAVIIDSGTSAIVGRTDAVQVVYENIPGSEAIGGGSWTFPCDNNVTVSIQIGGTAFAMTPETLSLGTYDSGSNTCVGSIIADDSFNFWIVGDPFLLNVYTIFDVGNRRLGFASL